MSKISQTQYKSIVAWGRYMQSRDYYIQDQIALAEKDRAPLNAIYKRDSGWKTTDDIQDPLLKARIEDAVS